MSSGTTGASVESTDTDETETIAADDRTPIENRSEIVFVYDAVNCNPNGNPIDADGGPRIDEETDHCYVTDVRLKRYIRDEFATNGETIYIANTRTDDGDSMTREQLLKRLFGIDIDADDKEVLEGDFFDQLIGAIDVRLFGALLSIEDEVRKQTDLPAALTGPVQFSPGVSLHPVERNYETGALTSVIGTKEGKQQGGFDLADERIKYGLFAFGGRVDPGHAQTSRLSSDDVRHLDEVTWSALKNQTMSRSKTGQLPRLYLRVEYEGDAYVGGLDGDLGTVEDDRKVTSARSIRDVTIDASELLRRLDLHSDRIERLHVATDDLVRVSVDGEPLGENSEPPYTSTFVDELREIVPVETVDVPGNMVGRW
jgi:CRISPR-associated protein Csh2